MISVGTVDLRSVAMLRSGIGLSCAEPGDRHVEQRFDRVDVFLEVLHAHEVLVLAHRVDPEVLLVKLDARVERGHDVLHDLGLVELEVGHLGAVDFDDVLRVVEPLDDPGIDHAVDRARPRV